MAKKIFRCFNTNMKIQSTGQNFTGYKNVISNELYGTNGNFAFITAQLNNEGKADLKEYKKFKQMMGFDKKAVENDVITIIQSNKYHYKPLMLIDGQPLLGGEDLKKLYNMVPDIIPSKEYKKVEDVTLKAYTLMADITKRMMMDTFKEQDIGLKQSIKQFMRVMTLFTQDNDAAFDLLDYSLRKNNHYKKVAERINNAIVKTMSAFF